MKFKLNINLKMFNNPNSIQESNNLFFSQKIKGLSDYNYNSNYYSSEKQPNSERNNLQRTYELQNLPNLLTSSNLKNKDNNLYETSGQNDLNNQNKTFSNKYYSLNHN